MVDTSQREELKNRVEAQKHNLEARLEELRADTRQSARNAADGIQEKLATLESHLRDGWDSVTEDVAGRLNKWLKSD